MAMHDVLMTWVFAPTDAEENAAAPTADSAPPSPRNYVQGMSDLFSPLYVVLDGEQWLCYALFEYQMERQADNFLVDQSGMARQLAELQSLLRVMDRGLYHHFGEVVGSTKASRSLLTVHRWRVAQRRPVRSTSFSASGGS